MTYPNSRVFETAMANGALWADPYLDWHANGYINKVNLLTGKCQSFTVEVSENIAAARKKYHADVAECWDWVEGEANSLLDSSHCCGRHVAFAMSESVSLPRHWFRERNMGFEGFSDFYKVKFECSAPGRLWFEYNEYKGGNEFTGKKEVYIDMFRVTSQDGLTDALNELLSRGSEESPTVKNAQLMVRGTPDWKVHVTPNKPIPDHVIAGNLSDLLH